MKKRRKTTSKKRMDPKQREEEGRLRDTLDADAEKAMNPVGRPEEYSEEVANTICAHIASGKSLVRICKMPGMPCLTTFYRWKHNHPDFAARYASAREDQADTFADETVDIADTPQMGEETVTKDGYTEVRRGDMLGHRKLRVETRKWFAAKMQPKKYGERQNLALSNPDGGPVEISNPDDLSDEQLADIVRRSGAASAEPQKG
jgi:hypothetical protein